MIASEERPLADIFAAQKKPAEKTGLPKRRNDNKTNGRIFLMLEVWSTSSDRKHETKAAAIWKGLFFVGARVHCKAGATPASAVIPRFVVGEKIYRSIHMRCIPK